jgi:mRNA-degrading endonuclease RelE of RelBE toxin-antitoxin system
MPYFIEVSEEAKEQIDKLDKSIGDRIYRKISALGQNPQMGKPLVRSQKLGAMLWELRLFSPNVRIYYTIHKCEIIIEEVIYEGKVRVHRIGDKRSQRKDIDGLA